MTDRVCHTMQRIFQHDHVIALRDQDSVQVGALFDHLQTMMHRFAAAAALYRALRITTLAPSQSPPGMLQNMLKRLQAARRVMIVGNGGIALELV